MMFAKGKGDVESAPQRILIVGGGTAGWLSAFCLASVIKERVGSKIELSLIEASDVPTVGVGEATLPTIVNLFRHLGISESELMLECDATFKLGIRFDGWRQNQNQYFWHPFGDLRGSNDEYLSILDHWLRLNLDDGSSVPPHQLMHDCFHEARCCESLQAPRTLDAPDYTHEALYAYHLDAGKLATFLRKKSLALGVNHKVDTIQGVQLRDDGAIKSVVCRDSGEIDADLFIDCSGFSGFLINKALNEPFDSYKQCLPCDRAIAIQMPYDMNGNTNRSEPYTTATALSSGWSWRTPLTSRAGTGYVYASDYLDPDQAETEFRSFLGSAADGLPANHIKMRVGKTRRGWVANCVAIGLSGGFIEPLESTGIYLIERGILALIENFPGRYCEPQLADRFNEEMDGHYEEIRDFLVMHYILSDRQDTPFWQSIKDQVCVPAKLAKHLDLWKQRWPTNTRIGTLGALFPDYSYCCMLAGFGKMPQSTHAILALANADESHARMTAHQQNMAGLTEQLPSQRYFLASRKLRQLLHGKRAPQPSLSAAEQHCEAV
jgi:tryptophan halogenase